MIRALLRFYLFVVGLPALAVLVVLFAISPSGNASLFAYLPGGVSMLVSAAADGTQGNYNSGSFNSTPSISADGRYVAFSSDANNLVSGDSNMGTDIFVKDTQTGTITRASTDVAGNQAYHPNTTVVSTSPSISASGRFVAFQSNAPYLVPGDTNGTIDVFLKDTWTGAITRVSTDSSGAQGEGDSSSPSVSADGRYVAFAGQIKDSYGKNIYIKDTLTGTTTLASDSLCGSGGCYTPFTSADGRYITFASIDWYQKYTDRVFLKDMQTGTTSLVSTDSAGNPFNGFGGSVSSDGRFVALFSSLSNGSSVYVKDTKTGETSVASTDASGNPANNTSVNPSISGDGRYVAFSSTASNLVPGDTNGSDVFVKDRKTGSIAQISSVSGVPGNGESYCPVITASGRFLAFPSYASNLVTDTNNAMDIFLSHALSLPVNNIVPSGWLRTADTVVSADLTDDGSGIDSTSLYVSLDDSLLVSCSLTAMHVDCPASGMIDGIHTMVIDYKTNNGAPGHDFGTFNVDLINPSISQVSPSGWTKASSTISARLSDSGSGINAATASISLDGSSQPLAGCSVNSTNISCPASGLTAGHHSINVIVGDNAGNSTSGTYVFEVDSVAPSINNTSPSGAVNSHSAAVVAYFSDSDSGIDTSSAVLTVNGIDVTAQATITANHIEYQDADSGNQNIHLQISDNGGNVSTATWSFNLLFDYYFPWYDNQMGHMTWILGANQVGQADNALDIYLKNLPLQLGVPVIGGATVPKQFVGKMDGPVHVVSQSDALISERSLMGNSFEEIWATSAADLDSDYWWTVYDGSSMSDWIMIANPPDASGSVTAYISMHDVLRNPNGLATTVSCSLAPGESWTPTFPGVIAGPVEAGASGKVIASQRVLYHGAFNEMPGIATSQMQPINMWTWYDNNSPGAADWLTIGNPNLYLAAHVRVYIGHYLVYDSFDSTCCTPIAPFQTLVLRAPSGDPDVGMGGPVIVVSCADANCNTLGQSVFASQRAIWGPSFSEIAGTTSLSDNANWTWYDQAAPGVMNWVMVSNPNYQSSIWAEVSVAGTLRWTGTIGPGANAMPTFPGVVGGPVEVKAWTDSSKNTTATVFASQRVTWNGYFNEIVGKGL